MAPPRPAEHLVHGMNGPVVVVGGRVAAWLLSRAGLNEYHRGHRGDDPEVDQVLVALKLAAAAWLERNVGTDHGTRAADRPPQDSPSPRWLNTTTTARVLGITTRAVVKAISAGRLPAQRPLAAGGSTRQTLSTTAPDARQREGSRQQWAHRPPIRFSRSRNSSATDSLACAPTKTSHPRVDVGR